MNGWGALVGLAYGGGAASIVLYDGPWRAVAFHQRIQRALHGTTTRQRIGAQWLRALGGPRRQRIEARQRQAGDPVDAPAHVLRCLAGALIGVAAAMGALAVLVIVRQLRNPAAALLLVAFAGMGGSLVADRQLTVRVQRRQRAAAVALPSFVESIALAVGAGASLPTALHIVAARASGVLADGLRDALETLRDGATFDAVVHTLHDLFPFASMTRFIDAVQIALERGTPIVEVLHAQAADARQESRRLLLESAGRREVGMLVPVVFLVLPSVVVVALYPGFTELTSLTN